MFVRNCKILCLSFLLTAGCATTTAPLGWLPSSEASAYDLFGGWLMVEYMSSKSWERVDGELIAVEPDKLFVLPYSSMKRNSAAGSQASVSPDTTWTLLEIPKDQIIKANLMGYQSDHHVIGLWSVAGLLSTVSHGVILIFSAPVWLLAGLGSTASQSHMPELVYPKVKWEQLSTYARFPQGLPPGLDRTALRPKYYFPEQTITFSRK